MSYTLVSLSKIRVTTSLWARSTSESHLVYVSARATGSQIPEYLLYGAEEDVFSSGAGSWRAFWNHKIGGMQGIGEITVLDLGPVEVIWPFTF